MKLSKRANIIFMVCFLGFLFLGMAVTVLRQKETTSFYENRTLASVPALHRETFLNGTWFAGWETYLKDHAAGRSSLLKASAYIDLNILKRPVVNNIVVAEPYLLPYNGYETVYPAAIAEQAAKSADNLSALKDFVHENGGVFYYVAVSGQFLYDSAQYPSYLNSRADYFRTAVGDFKTDMAARGVPLIDMGDVFDAMGHPDNVYFKTDHHFTFDGAFITYQTIMDRLNADQGLNLPVLKSSDLTFKELENPFLGSRMREIFGLLPTTEKLKIGILNKEIPFTRTNNGTAVPPTVYGVPQNPWERVSYTVFMDGDIGETVIKTNRPSLPNVLIVGDSYTNAVESVLYTSFNEMHSIDLRWYTDETLADYIADYKPDVVIVLRDYSVLLTLDGNNKWR